MFPEIAAIGDVDNVVINFRSTSVLKLSFIHLSKKEREQNQVSIGHSWYCELLSLRSFWPRPETRGLWKGWNGKMKILEKERKTEKRKR